MQATVKKGGEAFSFEIDASWEAVRRVLADYTGLPPEELGGVDVLRYEWERNKAQLIELFPPTGRVEVEYAATPEDREALLTDDAVHRAVSAAASWLRRRLGAEEAVLHTDHRRRADRLTYCFFNIVGNIREASPASLAEGRLVRPTWFPPERKYVDGMRLGKYARAWLERVIVAVHPDEPRRVALTWTEEGAAIKAAYGYTEHYTFTPEDVELVITALSMVTSALKAAAVVRVVLSVNPLDILLASTHTTGWKSCHRLGGEYTTGPLAYMCDPCTAIAYAYTETAEYGRTGLVLPLKMWRQMVYFDLDRGAAVFSRHYPENKALFEKEVRRIAAHLLAKHLGIEGEPKWYFRRLGEYAVAGRGEEYDYDGLHRVCKEGGWHYQDAPSSGIRLAGEYAVVYPGVEELPCPACGELRVDGHCDEILCQLCGEWGGYSCARCDGFVPEEDAYFLSNDDCLCPDCYADYAFECYACGWRGYTDCGVYSETYEAWFCEDCYLDRFTVCDYCGAELDRFDGDYYRVGGEVVCENCYEERFAACAKCGCVFRLEGDPVWDEPLCPDCAAGLADRLAELEEVAGDVS